MKQKNKNITTITDPLIRPYFITKDEHCYTVHINISPNNEGGTKYIKPVGHYSNFRSCLESIAKGLTNLNPNYDSVKEYIEYYNNIYEKIKTITNLDI